MATRTQQVKECDRAMCRNRKGVTAVRIVVQVIQPELGVWVGDRCEGELCPTHLKLAKSQAAAMFKNSKTYGEPVEAEEGGPDESDQSAE